ENRGQKVGATIAHPHGQIYAYPYIPPRLVKELPHFVDACPLCDVRAENPLLFNGQYWRLEVPYAMRMPYEVRLVPQRHLASFVDLSEQERQEGARLMQSLIRAYDRFFGFRTALVMALYQRPTPPVPYHFRWEFLPIDRGGGKIKYLAGSELAMEAFVVDMVPEQVQERLQPFLDREIAKGETNG
ncbi:MAG: galactose-1-phosphate uridylyltransferase, partial [Sulfobacillus thermosulfidooxidans]